VKLLELINRNLVILTMRRSIRLLSPSERQRAFRISVYSLLSVFVDVAGLSLLIPVMMAANNPGLVLGPSPEDTSIAAHPSHTPSAPESRAAHASEASAPLSTATVEGQKPTLMHQLFVAGGFKSYESYMVFMAVVLLAVFLIKNVVALAVGYLQSRFAYDIATNLARRQYIKFYHRGYRYFKKTNSADIVNNIINIPIFYAGGVLLSLINFLTEIAVLILIIVGIAIVDVRLFGALIIVLVPSGMAIYGITKNRLYAIGQQQSRLGGITMARIHQAIFGFVDVKLTNKETQFLHAYEKEQVRLNESLKLKHMISMVPGRALEVIAILGILVIFLYAFFMRQGSGTIFEFVTIFAAAAFRVLPSMNRSLAALMGIKGHMFSLEALEDGELPTEMLRMDVVRPLKFEETLEFRDVSFAFEDSESKALCNLNLLVKKGEKIGVIGESGAGKTTLMNILLRFFVEDQGGIYVDGKKLDHDDVASWRAKVGYVQQQVFLIDGTLKENVAFGEKPDEIDEERLRLAIEQASLMDFVLKLPDGWDTQVGEMGARLSGGQRQRIGIARALYFQSSVLIFDEATSSLDTDTENLITESIQALQHDKTVFVIAHRITTLRNCDRIIELKDGGLHASWTYPELVRERMLK
jgi:ABC-type multidrug transport system fused ATPase/permease subunit